MMPEWVRAALWALLAAFLLLSLLPGVASCFFCFGRKRTKPLDENPERLALIHDADRFREPLLRAIRRAKAEPHALVRMTAADGTGLAADWYDRASRRTAVLVPGYGTHRLNSFAPAAVKFLSEGWNVLLLCQRGHDESGGRACTFGLREQGDLLAWLDWLHALKPEGETLVWGISMGCATASYAGDRFPPHVRCAVFDCGYCVPMKQLRRETEQRHAPFVLEEWVVRLAGRCLSIDLGKSTLDSLRHVTVPSLFLHGAEDDKTPREDMRSAYDACGSADKHFMMVSGAGHTQAFLADGPAIWEHIDRMWETAESQTL